METKSPKSKDLVLEVSVRLHVKQLNFESKKSWIITLVIALVHLGLQLLIKHH
jgi:hypothetical protein